MTKRKLILDDGTTFVGEGFGSEESRQGGMIFFTGMTGYQEMMTDASYAGKMVVMTYPTIGAYGINRDDFESVSATIEALIVKELCDAPVNFRSEETVHEFMKRNHIPGISGVDTRKLTKHIRDNGVVRGIIVDHEAKIEDDAIELPTTKSLIEKVTPFKPYVIPGRNKRMVVLDLGIKQSILRELTEQGAHLTVVPYNYALEEIEALKPDGIIISNGPGNPLELEDVVETIKHLKGKYPLFGVGLGHQLVALAVGCQIERLDTGIYGVNIPVQDVIKDKTWMTTMSHDYIVCKNSIPKDFQLTHLALNNQAVAGLKNDSENIMTVQFHPEGAPGPSETNSIFTSFMNQIEKAQNNNGGMQHA